MYTVTIAYIQRLASGEHQTRYQHIQDAQWSDVDAIVRKLTYSDGVSILSVVAITPIT